MRYLRVRQTQRVTCHHGTKWEKYLKHASWLYVLVLSRGVIISPHPLSHTHFTPNVMLIDQPRNTCTHDYKRSVILISHCRINWVIMGSILATNSVLLGLTTGLSFLYHNSHTLRTVLQHKYYTRTKKQQTSS